MSEAGQFGLFALVTPAACFVLIHALVWWERRTLDHISRKGADDVE